VIIPPKVTDRAFTQLARIGAGDNGKALRVAVDGGGCSGFQYGFQFDETSEEDDILMEYQGVKVIVDMLSLQYLSGAEIDFKDDIMGSRFLVNNPNASATCGCGSSFSI